MSMFGHIAFAARTDVGRKRKNNEDAFGTFPEAGIFCVADGMGGGDDGEIASAAVVKAVGGIAERCTPSDGCGYAASDVAKVLEESLDGVSDWILGRAREKDLSGCGSTFVGVVLDATCPDTALAVHSGDSRLYLLRGRSIRQVTRDHSAAEMLGAKDKGKIMPGIRNMVTNAVGIRKSADAERTPFKIEKGDRILICSDGLYGMVPDKRMAAISRENAQVDEAVQALVAAALEAGGVDNVTVVLVEIGSLPPPARAIPVPEATIKEDPDSDSPTILPTPAPPIQCPRPIKPLAKPHPTARLELRDRRCWIIGGGVALLVIVLAVIALARPRRAPAGDGVGDGGGMPGHVALTGSTSVVSEVRQPVSAEAQDVSGGKEADAPMAGVAKTASPARHPVRDEGVEAPARTSAGMTTAMQDAPPEAAGQNPHAGDAVCSNLVEACASEHIDTFAGVVKSLFKEGDAPGDFQNQWERFRKSAGKCALQRTAKASEMAVVDFRIMLKTADSAKTRLSSGRPSPVGLKWIEAWDAVVGGDAKDVEVQEKCAFLINNAKEVRGR